jgi:6,7-dimethyl-8-ribityllumazine synthase
MATSQTHLSAYNPEDLPDVSKKRFGIVVSQWNGEITGGLLEGALQTLLDSGVDRDRIFVWEVPGSFELVYGCAQMAKQKAPDAIIALGSVIRGETAHFDFVCSGVTQGITQLNTQLDLPVIFGVLTDDTLQQAKDRSGGRHGNKGIEAAVTAMKMTALNP